jgi:hypothetical protein
MIKSFENGNIKEHNNKEIINDRNNIIIYKEDDNYIVKKNNIVTIGDYKELMYKVFINNRNNNNIYYVNVEDEDIKNIALDGERRRNYVLPIEEIETDPFYNDGKNNIAIKLNNNEYIFDIEYSVIDRKGYEERFSVKMNYIYDVELSYTEGDLVNTEYVNEIKSLLEDKFKTNIILNNENNKEKVYQR